MGCGIPHPSGTTYSIGTPCAVYVCVYVCMYVCVYVCMYVCMYACMHACMHVCMYACMYVCMHACMYVQDTSPRLSRCACVTTRYSILTPRCTHTCVHCMCAWVGVGVGVGVGMRVRATWSRSSSLRMWIATPTMDTATSSKNTRATRASLTELHRPAAHVSAGACARPFPPARRHARRHARTHAGTHARTQAGHVTDHDDFFLSLPRRRGPLSIIGSAGAPVAAWQRVSRGGCRGPVRGSADYAAASGHGLLTRWSHMSRSSARYGHTLKRDTYMHHPDSSIRRYVGGPYRETRIVIS